MELIKLSKFKLQLQTLTTEVRELREKERASSNQLHNYVQKQKQSDEEFSTKIKELEADLASCNELRHKLERKVEFLEDENHLLESKHKELKETISSILQAKEGFVKAYQESTCEMKRSIESKDRKIAILSEKINAHLLSFDTIRKEASFVKQLVDNADRIVYEKEEVEKIKDLETKLKIKESESHRKDMEVAELHTQLQKSKISAQCQPKIEETELQETIQMKEGIIQTLISENKALHSEVGMLVVTVKKIQETMTCIGEEDRVALPIMVTNQEKNADHKDSRALVADNKALVCKDNADVTTPSPLTDYNNANSCMSTFSSPSPVHLDAVEKLDSECSTTQGGT